MPFHCSNLEDPFFCMFSIDGRCAAGLRSSWPISLLKTAAKLDVCSRL